MNRIALTLIIGALTAVPEIAQGQGEGGVRTAINPDARPSTPVQGFRTEMRPGPGNAYTHDRVTLVVKGSNAERAGLEVGDVILDVDGRDVRGVPLFPSRVPGTRYLLRIKRGAEEMELTFIYPEPPPPASSSQQPRAAPKAGGEPDRRD